VILWDRLSADPHLILFKKSNPPWRVAFLWRLGLANKKTPPKAGFLEEHIQESVLVSTLKRRSALLTQAEIKTLNYDWSLCRTLW
jgi:hypothetical protein